MKDFPNGVKNTSHQRDLKVIGSSCAYPRITTPTEIRKVSWTDVILNRSPPNYKNELK